MAHAHKEFIENLGTPTSLGAALGTTPQEISKMKIRGVPWPWRARFVTLAVAMGVELPDQFMGESL